MKEKKPSISVALATFNEEANIGDCLRSVGWADEMVVVDGSSTDGTRQLAKRMGARVIKTTNKPMFHTNKNLAIEACRGDWVLMLDADERVTPELGEEMAKIAAQKWTADQPAGYWLKRKNFFLTRYLKKGGQYPDPVIRFFKRGKGIHPCVSVHEQIRIDGEVGCLEHDLIHLASPTFARYLTRENRYSTLEAEALVEQSVRPGFTSGLKYLIVKPAATFLSLFIRHRGYVDGFPGFVFAFCSGIHFALSYVKLWERTRSAKKVDIRQTWV